MFLVKMADHDENHRCLVKKNVPIALILTSRWRDGADSIGIKRTSCLCFGTLNVMLFIQTATTTEIVRRCTDVEIH